MFAPPITKAHEAAANPASKLASQRSTFAARRFADSAAEQAPMLQRGFGNQATLRLLAQRAAGLTGYEPSGDHKREATSESMTALEAPRVSWDFSKIPLFPPDRADGPQPSFPPAATPLPGVIQAKLVVAQVDDPLEHEADRVAEQVTGPSATAHVEPKTPGVFPAAVQTRTVAHVSGDRVDELGGGAPLELSVRTLMEPRFGRDFSDVRVHTGAEADRSARSYGALAYTRGRNVVFRDGQYAPDTSEGQRLLAHELAHVVQQSDLRAGTQPSPIVADRANYTTEHFASLTTDRTIFGWAGKPAVNKLPLRVPSGTLQRQPDNRDEEEQKRRLQPPVAGPSIRQQIEEGAAGVGIVASIISVLEVATPRTIAAAGVGTTVGALLLPIGAFFLGTAIREQADRRDQALEDFRNRLTGSAIIDAIKRAVSMLGHQARPLNKQGRDAALAITLRRREMIHNDIQRQLLADSYIQFHSEETWQALYDKWVEGNAQDLYKVYNNSENIDWLSTGWPRD